MTTKMEPQESGDANDGAKSPPRARAMQGMADAPPITPRRRKPTRASKWRRRVVMLVLLAAAGTATAAYWKPISAKMREYTGAKTTTALTNIQTYTVKRGELRVTMVEEGKLRAVNNSTIRLGSPNSSGRIAWLAEAGSKVKKGDKVAALETKAYEDQKIAAETELETLTRTKEQAEKQVPIAESSGKAAIADAETRLGDAEVALKNYKTIDVRKKLNDLENAVNDARAKLADQVKKTADLQIRHDAMLDEGKEKNDLETQITAGKQSQGTLQRTVDTAESQRKLFRQVNYPQDLKSKERAVENAKLAVIKAQVQAENDLLSKKSEVTRLQNTIKSTQTRIDTLVRTIANAVAYAPTDGLIYYGGADFERYGLSADSIKVGADWYYSYPVMTIPDLSSFQVTVPIAEVYRGRAVIGMAASVTIDAIPGLVLSGKLLSISSVSRSKVQYDSNSPSVYDAVLSLPEVDQRMVAGMTVRVEIITGTLNDILYVPVEAVFNDEGQTAVFMWIAEAGDGENAGGRVEKRPVRTGQASDHFVEIKKGLIDGDKLLLSRPTAFVMPRNYREMADEMAPPPSTGSRPAAATVPASASAPASAPPAVK